MFTKRQKQIIEEAVNIIHSKGIQGFTIKNLSKALGLTEAAIYRHFKSKTEILCSVLDNFIVILSDYIASIKEANTTSLDKIKDIFDTLSTTFTNKPAYVSIIFAEEIFNNEKSLSARVSIILKKNNDAFKCIIEAGQKNNEISKDINSQELTLITMGAFRLMVKNWNMCNFDFNLKQSSEKLYNSIVLLIKV